MECNQKSLTPTWQLVRLDVFDRLEAHQAMLEMEEEIKYGPGGEAIANGVIIGDNIVVFCKNRIGEQFWLFLCDKPKHMVTKTFVDAYKNTYYEKDSVIRGRYYELIWPWSKT
jgi:hypothetical protein